MPNKKIGSQIMPLTVKTSIEENYTKLELNFMFISVHLCPKIK